MPHVMKLIGLVTAALSCVGCATNYRVTRYDGGAVSQAAIDQAAEVCRGLATAASMNRTYQAPANSVIGAVAITAGNAMQQEQVYKSCMAQRGYRMTPVEAKS